MPKTAPQRKRKKGLSLKFDEKMRFRLDFAAKRSGKSFTAFIEEMIERASAGTGWEAFWHPSEGVRELLRLRYGGSKLSAADDELQAFVLEHDDLFFRDTAPRVPIVDALWPDLALYLKTWKETRGTPDADKAGKLMRAVVAKLPKAVR